MNPFDALVASLARMVKTKAERRRETNRRYYERNADRWPFYAHLAMARKGRVIFQELCDGVRRRYMLKSVFYIEARGSDGVPTRLAGPFKKMADADAALATLVASQPGADMHAVFDPFANRGTTSKAG